MPDHDEDFGLTLGVWGVPEGAYLVLPLLGPDPPRDIVGQAADIYLDPTHWLHYKQHIWWDLSRSYVALIDERAVSYPLLLGIERNSVDAYATRRSLYRQQRAHAILNGRPDLGNLPDF